MLAYGVGMRVRIVAPRQAQGPRIVINLGHGEHPLTVSEATDLQRAIGDALFIVAKRHGDIDPRINDPNDTFDKEP